LDDKNVERNNVLEPGAEMTGALRSRVAEHDGVSRSRVLAKPHPSALALLLGFAWPSRWLMPRTAVYLGVDYADALYTQKQ
jgi:hypothetical protein